MGVGGKRHAPTALTSGKKTRYPLLKKLDGPQEWNISALPGSDSRTVRPVVSRRLWNAGGKPN